MDFNSNSDDNQASSTSNHRKRPGRPKKHVKDDEKRAANNERDANYRKKKKIEESEKRVQQKEAKEMNDKLELEYSGMLTKHTSMFKEYLKILRSINLPPDPKFNWNEPVPLPGNKTDFTGVEKNITDYKHELITSEKNYSLKIEEHKQQPYVNASKKFHVKKDITATYESEIFGIRKNINELYKTLIKGICDINQNLEEEIKQLKNVNIESFAEDKSIYDFILPSNESQMLFNNAQEPYYDYSSNHPIHPPPTNFQFPISDFSHENPAPQIYEQLFDTTTTLLQSNQSESKLQDFNYGATSNSCRNGHHQNPHPEYQPNVQLANDGGTVNRKS
uniref:BZIP domain-containing protein n=1 Tax=Panagrolaimus sp. ES5 TaxID=591445 RepID=A0AC34FVB1_9BILA